MFENHVPVKQRELFRPPAHELLIDTLAKNALAEISAMAQAAQRALTERFKRIAAFANRSAAQRKRFERIRQLGG
jgi:hypothetical protein